MMDGATVAVGGPAGLADRRLCTASVEEGTRAGALRLGTDCALGAP